MQQGLFSCTENEGPVPVLKAIGRWSMPTFSTGTSFSVQLNNLAAYGTINVLIWHFRGHKDKIGLFPRLQQSGNYSFLRSKVIPVFIPFHCFQTATHLQHKYIATNPVVSDVNKEAVHPSNQN